MATNLAPTDLTQTINPWTWWIKSFGQLGFININETSSGDPAVEQQVVTQVASYGRQLGWISEALDIIIRHPGLRGLSATDKAKLEQVGELVKQVEEIKADNRTAATDAQIDRLVSAVERLKGTDRALFGDLAARLRPLVVAEPPPIVRAALPAPTAPPVPLRKPKSPARKSKARR
jgi:hypothetical protein